MPDMRQTLARRQIFSEINAERARQDQKFGWIESETSVLPGTDEHRKMSVLGEEVGEVAKALLERDWGNDTTEHVEQELVQVAAVCVAWLEAARIKRNLAERRTGISAYDYTPRMERPCAVCREVIVYHGDELVHRDHPSGLDHEPVPQGRRHVMAANREAVQSPIMFGGINLPAFAQSNSPGTRGHARGGVFSRSDRL